MHWITVLGNVVLPSIRRTKEEIRTGKIRQFKARMCLVVYAAGQMQTLVVDDHVLFGTEIASIEPTSLRLPTR